MTHANDNRPAWRPGDPRPADLSDDPETRTFMLETIRDVFGKEAAGEIETMFETFPGKARVT